MKRITLDDSIKEELLLKFKQHLNTLRLSDSQIQFRANIYDTLTPQTKPTVYIDPEAYLKIMLYVRDTSTEIAWHGTVERYLETNTYYIKDVFLYPQKVTGATVQTDQAQYNQWLENLDDDTYNQLRFQGHSHVNFGTSPSGTDLQYYNDILQVLPRNDYYIFMIINKSGDLTLFIYDLATNLIYETNDIDIKITTRTSTDLLKEIKQAKQENCTNYTSITQSDAYKAYNNIITDRSSTIDELYGYGEESTLTDKIFEELDYKWKNPKLNAPKQKTKKVKTKGGK